MDHSYMVSKLGTMFGACTEEVDIKNYAQKLVGKHINKFV